MPNITSNPPDTEKVRAVINEFLQERLQAKLDKLKDDDEEQRKKLREAYQPSVWIADAARRVTQIQQVTHALKYTHPEAKGTSLNSSGNPDVGNLLVGSHTLQKQIMPDVVGNAAALDVYKFLRLEAEGKTLLNRAIENDAALSATFSEDAEQAKGWMVSFAAVIDSKGSPGSHTLAKQIYWPIDDAGYNLLSPLFPTSLVHNIWHSIRQDRFSEESKAARVAKKANTTHSHGYREYPNIVVQQFGGTQPQNISQLNSERYGENYLLPSVPPNWQSKPVTPPLRVDSIFDGWCERRPRVRSLLKTLQDFLYSVKDAKNNLRIRNKRIELLGYLVDEVILFAAELRELEELWTLHEECKLNSDEQCWLNPVRADSDPEFLATYTWGDWKDNVCKRFGNWLNARLANHKQPLPFDKDSASQWDRDLKKELQMLRQEVSHYE